MAFNKNKIMTGKQWFDHHARGQAGNVAPSSAVRWERPDVTNMSQLVICVLQFPIKNKSATSFWDQIMHIDSSTTMSQLHEFALFIVLYLAVGGVEAPWLTRDAQRRGTGAQEAAAGSESSEAENDTGFNVEDTPNVNGTMHIELLGRACDDDNHHDLVLSDSEVYAYRVWFIGPNEREGGVFNLNNCILTNILNGANSVTQVMGDKKTVWNNLLSKTPTADVGLFHGTLYYLLRNYLKDDIGVGFDVRARLVEMMRCVCDIPGWVESQQHQETRFMLGTLAAVPGSSTMVVDANQLFGVDKCPIDENVRESQRYPLQYADGVNVFANAPKRCWNTLSLIGGMSCLLQGYVPRQPREANISAWAKGNGNNVSRWGRHKSMDFGTCIMPSVLSQEIHVAHASFFTLMNTYDELLNEGKCYFVELNNNTLMQRVDCCNDDCSYVLWTMFTIDNEPVCLDDVLPCGQYKLVKTNILSMDISLQQTVHPLSGEECQLHLRSLSADEIQERFTGDEAELRLFAEKWRAHVCRVSNDMYDKYVSNRMYPNSRPQKLMKNYMSISDSGFRAMVQDKLRVGVRAENFYVGVLGNMNIAAGQFGAWIDNSRVHAEQMGVLHSFGNMLFAACGSVANCGNIISQLGVNLLFKGSAGSGKSQFLDYVIALFGGGESTDAKGTERSFTAHQSAASFLGALNALHELPAVFTKANGVTEEMLMWLRFLTGEEMGMRRAIREEETGKIVLDTSTQTFVLSTIAATNMEASEIPSPILDRFLFIVMSQNPMHNMMLHQDATSSGGGDAELTAWRETHIKWWGMMLYFYTEYWTVGVIPSGRGTPDTSRNSEFVKSRLPYNMSMAMDMLNAAVKLLKDEFGVKLNINPRLQNQYVYHLMGEVAVCALQHSQGLAGYMRYCMDKQVKASCEGSIGTFLQHVHEEYGNTLYPQHVVAALSALLCVWIDQQSIKSPDASSTKVTSSVSGLTDYVRGNTELSSVYRNREQMSAMRLQHRGKTTLYALNGNEVASVACNATYGSSNLLVFEKRSTENISNAVSTHGFQSVTFHILLSSMLDTFYRCGSCNKPKTGGPCIVNFADTWQEDFFNGTCGCSDECESPKPYTMQSNEMSAELLLWLQGLRAGDMRVINVSSSCFTGTSGFGPAHALSHQTAFVYVVGVDDDNVQSCDGIISQLFARQTHVSRVQVVEGLVPSEFRAACCVGHNGAWDTGKKMREKAEKMRFRTLPGGKIDPAYMQLGTGTVGALADCIVRELAAKGGNVDKRAVMAQLLESTMLQKTSEGYVVGSGGDMPKEANRRDPLELPCVGLDICLKSCELSVDCTERLCKTQYVLNNTTQAKYYIRSMGADGSFSIYPIMQMHYNHGRGEMDFPQEAARPVDVCSVIPFNTRPGPVDTASVFVTAVDSSASMCTKSLDKWAMSWSQRVSDGNGGFQLGLNCNVQRNKRSTVPDLVALSGVQFESTTLEQLTEELGACYGVSYMLSIHEEKPNGVLDAYVRSQTNPDNVVPAMLCKDALKYEWEAPTSLPAFVMVNSKGVHAQPGRKGDVLDNYHIYGHTQMLMDIVGSGSGSDTAASCVRADFSTEQKVFSVLQQIVNNLPKQVALEFDAFGGDDSDCDEDESNNAPRHQLSRHVLTEGVEVSVAAQVFVRGGGELDGGEHYVHTVNGSKNRVLAAHLCHPECTCSLLNNEFYADKNCVLGFSEHVLKPGDSMSLNNFTYAVCFDPSKHTLRYAENIDSVPVEFITYIQASKVWQTQNQKFDKRTGRALNTYSMDLATLYQQPIQSSGFSDQVPVKGAVWKRDAAGKYVISDAVDWVSPYGSVQTDTEYKEACKAKIRRERLAQTVDNATITTQADLNIAEVIAAFHMDKSENKKDTKEMFISKTLYGSSNAAHTAASRDLRIIRGPYKRSDVNPEAENASVARKKKKMWQRAQFAQNIMEDVS